MLVFCGPGDAFETVSWKVLLLLTLGKVVVVGEGITMDVFF